MSNKTTLKHIWKSFDDVIENLSWYWVQINDDDLDTLINIIEHEKSEKHIHLDGSVNYNLLRSLWFTWEKSDLYAVRGEWLDKYLEPFYMINSFLQTEENLYQVAKQFVFDQAKENITYTEVRYDPHLHTFWWLSLKQVIDAVNTWLIDWMKEYYYETWIVVRVRTILGINRWLSVDEGLSISNEMLDIVNSKESKNMFVWFDLNCSENGNPPDKFKDAIKAWQESGFKVKIHAGESISDLESDKSAYVKQAIALGVDSIWHWILCEDYEETLSLLKSNNIEIEINVASNLQTWSTKSMDEHPIGKYIDYWLNLSINTDNKTVWNISLSEEILLIHKKFNIPLEVLFRYV